MGCLGVCGWAAWRHQLQQVVKPKARAHRTSHLRLQAWGWASFVASRYCRASCGRGAQDILYIGCHVSVELMLARADVVTPEAGHAIRTRFRTHAVY
jgi:hypothetical protein